MSGAEHLIRELAARHGTAVGRDDPILILHTLNELLMADNAQAQQAMLTRFEEEMEATAARWDAAAKTRADKVLTAALAASQDAMKDLMTAGAGETTAMVRRDLDRALGQLDAARHLAIWNLLASILTLAAAGLAVWVTVQG